MSKKYVITKTGEEVKIGDIIACKEEQKTSFGTIRTTNSFTVTAHNIDTLVKQGILKCIEPKEDKKKDLTFYLKSLAVRIPCSVKELTTWLERINGVCPRAVLDILLGQIALEFLKTDPLAYDNAECYYSLKLKDGTVGKVVNLNEYLPLFKSKEDAEYAREILKDQLEFMYGK